MEQKKIAVCSDETFHPEICLVAIESVSHFILIEVVLWQESEGLDIL